MEGGIMKMKSKSAPVTFDALTSLRPLRPIRNEADLDCAQTIADRLAILNRRTRDQEDYLETLSLLIETYENRHHQIDTADLDPIDLLRSLMEARGMSASDLGRLLGNRSLGAAILRGERQLSKANIVILSKHFAVGPQLFLKTSPRVRKAG
jgi:HTH-type transcriptional regulator / antitoxin HigA